MATLDTESTITYSFYSKIITTNIKLQTGSDQKRPHCPALISIFLQKELDERTLRYLNLPNYLPPKWFDECKGKQLLKNTLKWAPTHLCPTSTSYVFLYARTTHSNTKHPPSDGRSSIQFDGTHPTVTKGI